MEKIKIFCDFDGTITKEDTLNKFLHVYADKKWLEIEELWIEGKIGSKECIEEQLKLVPKISEEELESFIGKIEIDDSFQNFYQYVQQQNIEFTVLSDGFDYFINKIFDKYKIKNVKIFCNKLIINNGVFIPEFPHYYASCKNHSGVCKCKFIDCNGNDEKSLYIGDGLSDVCVSSKVDLLFAKDNLLEYCKFNKIEHFDFNNFSGIKEFLTMYGERANAKNG